ncbi:MAG: glycogen debranching protein, partial [Firmicutes bacterium HGW-Firmicutes-13]
AAGGYYQKGYEYLHEFRYDPLPTFVYQVEDILIEKRIFMVYGENTTIIRYRIESPGRPYKFRLFPLVNYRDYHWINHSSNGPFIQEIEDNTISLLNYTEMDPFYLSCSEGSFTPFENTWYERMEYIQEIWRGESSVEFHYMPGVWEIKGYEPKEFAVIATMETRKHDPQEEYEKQVKRIDELIEKAGSHDYFVNQLVLAADSFIVQRKSTNSKTIIAGYHWFVDWGRDTMISLPGLTLVTKRFEEAREILKTFASYCQEGLIPNTFPDKGGDIPSYNTVDASLWYFHAAARYLEYTGDIDFIKKEIYPVLSQIIDYYQHGTKYNIRMYPDGLIFAGSPDTQLTWMDAKVDGWVVTSRHGKAVEINALWYNALRIMENLAVEFGDKREESFRRFADLVKKNFHEDFWNTNKEYLYDVVSSSGRDDSLRPNQILAVSLPYSLLSPEEEKKVVVKIFQELFTPYGLRTLSPSHPDYKGRYEGNRWQRDAAYHQGTVWSWLLGPFISAYLKVHQNSEKSRYVAREILAPFRRYLFEHGVGTVNEIFDGDFPHHFRGCIAQAWGVAEVLRCYVEDVLGEKPERRFGD